MESGRGTGHGEATEERVVRTHGDHARHNLGVGFGCSVNHQAWPGPMALEMVTERRFLSLASEGLLGEAEWVVEIAASEVSLLALA
jgi:hypothetical protein